MQYTVLHVLDHLISQRLCEVDMLIITTYMRQLELLEINLPRVTQLATAISIPGILIPVVIHIMYSSSPPLTNVINI